MCRDITKWVKMPLGPTLKSFNLGKEVKNIEKYIQFVYK